MTKDEIEELHSNIRNRFDSFYQKVYDSPKLFLVIRFGNFTKYISPVAQTRGARDLFVPSSEEEFNDFVEKTGGMIVADDCLTQGDCICDVTVDADGNEVRTYLKYDPDSFGAKEEYIIPNQIYSSIEEFKNDYFR